MYRDSYDRDPAGPLAALRHRWWLIGICLLLGAGAALVFSKSQTKQYSASAILLFRDPGFNQIFGSTSFQTPDPTREAATNQGLVSLGAVADLTAKRIGDGLTATSVAEHVSVATEGQSDLVSVTATEPEPTLAATLANAYAKTYVDFRRRADQKKVAAGIRLLERNYAALAPETQQGQEGQDLQRQLSQLQALKAIQTGNAEVVQSAGVPSSPSSPSTGRNTILGGILGLLVGAGLALLLGRLDRRLRKPGELESVFALPLLATIPNSRALGGSENGARSLGPGEAEAFRMLRTQLRYFNVDRNIRTVLVTSASAGDGKSTVAWYLASSAAESGANALLLEADFHRATVAEQHDLEPFPGLAELLSGQVGLKRAVQRVGVVARSNGSEVQHTLRVIVAGATPPNPGEIIESSEMSQLIDYLAGRFDLIVIDTPPTAAVADAIPLMKMVDGVIVVGQIGKTTRDEATHLRDQLGQLDAPMLGVVANRVPRRRGSYAYGYGAYADEGRKALGRRIRRT